MSESSPTTQKRTRTQPRKPAPQQPRARRSRLGGAILSIAMFGVGGVIGFGGYQFVTTGVADTNAASVSNPAQPSTASRMASAVKAVERTMPNAAIVGASPGPAQTTKVTVQLPGAGGMQVVYVLSDGNTVMSGVVLDSMAISPASDAAPGAAPKRESGSAPANASQNQTGTNPGASIQGFEVDAEGNPVRTPTPGLPEGVPATNQSDVEQKPKSDAEPAVPASSTNTGTSQGVDIPESDQAPETSSTAPAEQDDVKDDSVPAPGGSTASGDGLIIENIESLLGAEAFGTAVRSMLNGDADIDTVRQKEGTQGQQQAYYDLVTDMPAITQGEGPRHLYVMFDPNCPVCHTYYQDVYEDIQRGRVTVHWIPAVVFPDKRTSLSSSAIMIAEAESNMESGSEMLHRVMTERGYMDKLDNSDRVAAVTPYFESVVKNTAVMAMARPETPLIIFKDRNDNLTIESGLPTGGYIGKVKVAEVQ